MAGVEVVAAVASVRDDWRRSRRQPSDSAADLVHLNAMNPTIPPTTTVMPSWCCYFSSCQSLVVGHLYPPVQRTAPPPPAPRSPSHSRSVISRQTSSVLTVTPPSGEERSMMTFQSLLSRLLSALATYDSLNLIAHSGLTPGASRLASPKSAVASLVVPLSLFLYLRVLVSMLPPLRRSLASTFPSLLGHLSSAPPRVSRASRTCSKSSPRAPSSCPAPATHMRRAIDTVVDNYLPREILWPVRSMLDAMTMVSRREDYELLSTRAPAPRTSSANTRGARTGQQPTRDEAMHAYL